VKLISAVEREKASLEGAQWKGHRSRSPSTVLREEQNSMRRAVPTLRVQVVGKPEVKGKG